jgi:predicted nucleic acid-binding protein
MSWCFANESTPFTRGVLALLATTYAEVPTLWTFEVANVLAIAERRQRITSTVADEFMRTLAGLDIRVEQAAPPVDGKVLLPLVRRLGLTAYDAAYLELAKRKGLPLATLDTDLIRAAQADGIALVSQP